MDLILPLNEELVLTEGTLQNIIDNIKRFIASIIERIRLIINRLISSAREVVMRDKQFMKDNEESIKKGYELFVQSNAKLRGNNYANILTNLIDDSLAAMKEMNIYAKNIIDMTRSGPDKEYDPEYEYIRISRLIIDSEIKLEYKGFKEALNKMIEPREQDVTQYFKPETLMSYSNISDKVISSCNKELDNFKSLQSQLNRASIVSRFDGKKEREFCQTNILMLKNNIDIVMATMNAILSLNGKVRSQALNAAKIFVSYDKEDKLMEPNIEYNVNTGAVNESYGIFSEAVFI